MGTASGPRITRVLVSFMGASVPSPKTSGNPQRGFPGPVLPARNPSILACVLITLLLIPYPALAQPNTPGGAGGNAVSDGITYYTNKPSFLIPFNQDPNDWRINSVLLHISEDFGKTYRYLGYAQQNQRSFQFRAVRDGWYWFAVQTQDKQGRYSPANMVMATPGLKVCVDTQPPQIFLKGTTSSAGAATVDWEIRDDNADPASIRLETRAAGATVWSPLSAQPLLTGTHAWNSGVGSFDVRFSVRDKAGNLGEQMVTMVPGQTKTAGVQTAAMGTNSAQNNGLPPNVLMVNHRSFQLNFKLDDEGPSGVSRIEVWFTRDGGRSWRKFDQDAEKTPPCKLEVPEEGRYGFTLIARSGVELSEPPPKAGDLPHIWVEVDETKPQLRLLGTEVGRGIDHGTMTILWTAADKFLGQTPLALSYGTSAEGPWTVVNKELSNTGRYVWKMADSGVPYQLFVKLDCTDQAGNTTTVVSPAAVKVDLNTPRARVVGATAVGIAPANNGPSGAGTLGNGSGTLGSTAGSNGAPGLGASPGQGSPPTPNGGSPSPNGGGPGPNGGGIGPGPLSGQGAGGNPANSNPVTPVNNAPPQGNTAPVGAGANPAPAGGSPNGSAGTNLPASTNPLPGAETPKAPSTGQPNSNPATNPTPGAPGTNTSGSSVAPTGPRAQPLPSGNQIPGAAPTGQDGNKTETPAFPGVPPLPS